MVLNLWILLSNSSVGRLVSQLVSQSVSQSVSQLVKYQHSKSWLQSLLLSAVHIKHNVGTAVVYI